VACVPAGRQGDPRPRAPEPGAGARRHRRQRHRHLLALDRDGRAGATISRRLLAVHPCTLTATSPPSIVHVHTLRILYLLRLPLYPNTPTAFSSLPTTHPLPLNISQVLKLSRKVINCAGPARRTSAPAPPRGGSKCAPPLEGACIQLQ